MTTFVLPPAPREPEALTARHLLCHTLNVLRTEPERDLYSALIAAYLRSRALPLTLHLAQKELLSVKNSVGQYTFSLHDQGVEVCDLLSDYLTPAVEVPAARDTERCPPPAEMAVVLGDEGVAA